MNAEFYAEVSRILLAGSAWESNFRHYETLLDAGVSQDEAIAIVTDLATQDLDARDRTP
ncbi:hypothetical protein [Mesorhizobium sp. WSM4303]|uniref:hypothetical protein n=1 Tax=Mesorhizobium sp. WSM4303 TaxID=2589887 RepID=UPI00163D97BE|nr:hypothetical protein [Mesorhizobium sp. WSM4303]